jgi:hypothetical protein
VKGFIVKTQLLVATSLLCVKGADIRLRRRNILVNHTAETITTQNTSVGRGGHRRARRKRGLRRRETQSRVRTMPIVVVHGVGDDAFEVLVI